MKEAIMLINIIILSSLLLQTASAKSSNEFIDQVTNMICEDCQGKDIHLSQPMTYTSNDGSKDFTSQSISWPYDPSFIKVTLKGLDSANYSFIQGTCDNKITYTSGPGIIDGCGILTCGNYKLNIIGDTYYWRGKKIDFLKKEEFSNIASGNNNTQVINKGTDNAVNVGSNNIANTGDNSTVTQQDLNLAFNKGFFGGAGLMVIIDAIAILIQRWRKKK